MPNAKFQISNFGVPAFAFASVDEGRNIAAMRFPWICWLAMWVLEATAWGHTNLIATNFPAPYNSEPASSGAPLSAGEAARRFRLPAGFQISVFAAEPAVQNPIGLAWDRRGRLWIAENYTYAERGKKFERALRDRVVILEDSDRDGVHDKRTVFTDELQMLTSVEVGLGGVWLLCPPQLLFVPDRDADDRPDGAAAVVLDGFTVPPENYHNFANGLRWGPDGWLYGRCGASSPGEIGRPDSPASSRVPLRGGMWRYHPARKVFEALSHGTTNPWGHDWNEHGELFYINTVNGLLWHVVPGMHFVRPHTIDPNPRVYTSIDHHADHWHFDTGQGWANSRDGRADSYGGGHAHIGMMIYQGDNWPELYRGKLFTLNMHGRRANVERLERRGSGYVGRHDRDMLFAGDPWFRGMELSTGPDGGVYVLDWSDAGECHDSTGVHRTSGRVFKITYGSPQEQSFTGANEAALLEGLSDGNVWVARQAQQQLQARHFRGEQLENVGAELRELYRRENAVPIKLRYLWALYVSGQADPDFLRAQLQQTNEHVRAWAVRLLTDRWALDTVMGPATGRPSLGTGANRNRTDVEDAVGLATESPATALSRVPGGEVMSELIRLARNDVSPLVRLVLASTLQRVPALDRPRLAEGLLRHAEDADDHNLPLLIWYGLIPVADVNPSALAELGVGCEMPETLRCLTRRLTENNENDSAPLSTLLQAAGGKSERWQAAMVMGLVEGFKGWRKATPPAAWAHFAANLSRSSNPELRARVRELGVVFGDGRALEEVKRVALDGQAELQARRAALQALIDSGSAEARNVCEQLLNVRFLNSTAVRGLAAYEDAALGEKLARNFRSFHPSDRPALMETLATRPSFAGALLKEMAAGRIPKEELSAFHARQIRSFKLDSLNKALGEAWGELRELGADQRAQIERFKRELSADVLAGADKGRGRALFNAACAVCHRLYGHGGDSGPDLTGSGRENLDYLLENIVDPSAVVSADFKVTVVTLKDGRVFNGVITAQNNRTVSLKIMTGTLTLARAEIEEMEPSELSLMPEGLMDGWPMDRVRDLIGYLRHPTQVEANQLPE
jgi:putative membrane-bound dehydrogenase-like protein